MTRLSSLAVALAAVVSTACLEPVQDVTPPTVPQGVIAVSPLPTRVAVTWSPASDTGLGVGGYAVLRDGVEVARVAAPATAYQDDAVAAATVYAYTVRAYDLADPPNFSAPSSPANVVTLTSPDTTPPTVPGGVTASASGPDRVVVSWSPSTDTGGAGVAGYELRRDGALLATLAPTVTTYEDLTVLPATAYAYAVRAFDAADPRNVSADSTPAGVTTPALPDLLPPSVPGGVIAIASGPSRVVITWTASTDTGTAGLAGYEVRRGGVLLASVAAPATSYEDLTVQPSTAYTYTVRAFDAADPPNVSADSAPANVTTPAPLDTTAPSIPGGVIAIASGPTRVVVSWTASTDTGGAGLAGYEVRRGGVLLASVHATDTAYEDLTVQASTAYAYTVRAFDAASPPNVSADSAPANVTTPAVGDTTPPSIPGDVTATAPGSTRVVISWTASTDTGTAGLAGYEVRRGGALLASVAAPATSYEDLTVQPSTAYTYTVRAFDAADPPNVSADSAPANVTTPADTTPPSIPGGVTATASGPTRVVISWTASTDTGGEGLAGYEIRRGGALVASVATPATAYEDLTVQPSTAYTYTVRAFDAATPANVSADSAPANVTTPALVDTTPPSIPGGVTAIASGPTRVVVSWTASTDTGGAGLAGYEVRRGVTLLSSVAANVTSYEDLTVQPSTAYAYTVRAFDAAVPANVSADSATANVTTPALPGLDARPTNTTCLAPTRPTTNSAVQLVDAFPSLPAFTTPVAALQAPGDPSRWFVVEQGGVVRVFASSPGVATTSVFVDVSARVLAGTELGLLGMAFHPSWPVVPEVFLSYTRDSPRRTVIARLASADGGLTLDGSPAAEQVILEVDEPYDDHKAGGLAFGPDGYLYVGLGDGGSVGDPDDRAQSLTSLLGKFLRLDVGGTGAGYAIPSGNPYAANPKCGPADGTLPCPELWAIGFRRPWRWSFDRATGNLWAGDQGEDAREEVDRVEQGLDYGWRLRQGTRCYDPASGCPTPGNPAPNGTLLVDPELDYVLGQGTAVTGGYVYRGASVPSLFGLYVFGDRDTGRIWSHVPGAPAGSAEVRVQLLASGLAVVAFAEAADGELHVLDATGGRLHRLAASGTAGVDTVPSSLADTGCVSAANPALPSAGLIPYRASAPGWFDGATAERWMALPDGQTVTIGADLDLSFPSGSVLVQHLRLGTRLVETRLLMRHPDGTWGGYSYEWNDAGTAAARVRGGKERLVGTQPWVFPSEQQCLQCHSAVAGRSLGLELAQENAPFTYPSTGRTANQLHTLQSIGVFTAPGLPGDPVTLPSFPDPSGTAGTLAERARAWLHVNCSSCHRTGGTVPTTLDLRYTTALSATGSCNVTPAFGSLGLANARLLAPGAPASSVLLERVKRRDPFGMPPEGSAVVDPAGVQLLTDWIQSLTACN